MIISITRIELAARGRSARRAFTLPEVIIGATIGSIVLAGVMSAFLMLSRSGVNVANYSASEAEIRRGLEDFSQDVRMASNITWNSDSSITLTVPNNYAANSNRVTYSCAATAPGSTVRSFYRTPASPSASGGQLIYVRNVSSFAFARYNRLDAPATTDNETKRIQLTLNVRRTGQTTVAANTMAISASYLLRNKVAN
ncbi:MAG: prepilin-type N-terminal cleavage/methylation domain-containing protein [Opitutaceae bacterium]|nr:prepilin-type N-terminal cleavage/methylation domain-containing protein [Opitutaceae bacterium]